jgi:hypothetical protein
LKAHLKHGDYEGECDLLTYVPDDRFERSLIYWGYDDVMDDYVKTSNINTIESLWFQELDEDNFPPVEPYFIYDMTGIEDFTALKTLTLSNLNNLENLDLSKNSALEDLQFTYRSSIRNLTLPENSSLKNFIFNSLGSYCYFENIDLSTSTNLETFWIKANKNLTSLDFSNCNKLVNLNLMVCNDLESLNLKNGNNTSMRPYVGGSPNLNCIQVDDAAYSTTNWINSVDPWMTFSENCGY